MKRVLVALFVVALAFTVASAWAQTWNGGAEVEGWTSSEGFHTQSSGCGKACSSMEQVGNKTWNGGGIKGSGWEQQVPSDRVRFQGSFKRFDSYSNNTGRIKTFGNGSVKGSVSGDSWGGN